MKSFKFNQLVLVLSFFCAFMSVASENVPTVSDVASEDGQTVSNIESEGVQTTTFQDSDLDESEIIRDRFRRPHSDICSPNDYCAFRSYTEDGRITGAFTYCVRCSDGFNCTLVQDNTRKLYLRYKCLPAVVESSTEDVTEGVAETEQVQQVVSSWPKILDLTSNIFSKRMGEQDRFIDGFEPREKSVSKREGLLNDVHEL